eukprot:TRINITY_DN2323_c0_g1_i1.p1 TRINITY_DN2323_c0_g1~~TRINITY_DN2323_c0_g1_i1.p1  ORF type:complete len:1145 (+),score=327.32 TRINITY_DN2323_c0_g1_i1:67-3501(+)
MAAASRSKEFFDLIKAIGEAKSKQEEDDIITEEVLVLKTKMFEPKITVKTMKELLVRMIYVEMLGHDASFGHINAVKMTNDPNTLVKRIAYLAVCLCLHPNNDLMLLLVNTMQKDLKSPNHVEVSLALHTIAKLINKELIPAVIAPVGDALSHKQASVRKKAVMVLQRFFQIDKDSAVSYLDRARRLLCDKDPAVMGASLHLIFDLAVADPPSYKELVPSLVSILKQITEHRLPRDFDYHRMPAPWIQIKLLQILAVLGNLDKSASEGMYEILGEVLRRADIGINVGYAIIYETVRTITQIYPEPQLLEEAAKCVSRFITAENHNLKYLGINALANIVQIDSKYALDHQLIVIDCLEDPDETLRRKTLDLLYKMTNPANVVVIVGKLIASLKSTLDVFLRKELVLRITQLAERFAPHTFWYIDIMNEVFEQAGDLVDKGVPNNLMKLILETDVEDVDQYGRDVRTYAAEVYYSLLDKSVLPHVSLKVIAWVLGEFGHLLDAPREEVISNLCEVLDRPLLEGEVDIRCWVTSAILKLTRQVPTVSQQVSELLEKFRCSVDVDLQQRAYEFMELVKNPRTLQAVIPPNQASEQISVDEELSFLGTYVNQALRAGARAYSPPQTARSGSISVPSVSQFKMDAYELPPTRETLATSFSAVTAGPAMTTAPPAAPANDDVPKLAKKGPWGESGYGDGKPPAAPTPTPQPAYNNSPAYPTGPASGPAPPATPQPSGPVYQGNPNAPKTQAFEQNEAKLAQAQLIFGGGSSSSNIVSAGAKPKKTKNPKKAAPAATPAATPAAAPAQVAASTPSPAAPSNPVAVANPTPSPITTTAPPAKVAGKKNDDILDIFGFDAPPAPAASSKSSAKSGGADLFDLFGGSAEVKSEPAAVSLASGHDLMSAALRKSLEGIERSSDKDLEIGSDHVVRISSYKLFAPYQTIVAVFVGNLSRGSLQNVQLYVEAPSGFTIGFDKDPSSLSVDGTTVTIPSLASGASSVIFVSLAVSSPASSIDKLSVTVGYPSPGTGKVASLAFNIPITYLELLRPAGMVTEQFGGQWTQLTGEAKASIRSSVSTSPAAVARIQASRFHAVATIGVENIAAAYIVGGSAQTSQVVLAHVKVNAGTLDIMVHSSNKSLSANALAQLAALLG